MKKDSQDLPFTKGFATRSIHVGQEPDLHTGAVVTPIFLATTYQVPIEGEFEYEYSRVGHPNRTALEKCMCSLEQCKYCIASTSGSCGAATLIQTLSPGDEVITQEDMYGGLYIYFKEIATQTNGLHFKHIDFSKIENLKEAITPKTTLIWLESPCNPLLNVYDLKLIAETAHALNKDIIVVSDNTFMTPYFQNPLTLGVDVVIHSCSKYIGGHSDTLLGVTCTNNEQLALKIRFSGIKMGMSAPPLECYLACRSLKTLALRMKKHQENAMKLAADLESYPQITNVYYPGLPTHPGHEIQKKQASGFGGMISFRLKEGFESAKKFIAGLTIIHNCSSLGGAESTISIPALISHAGYDVEIRKKWGFDTDLMRFSVGIEDYDDLKADIFCSLDNL